MDTPLFFKAALIGLSIAAPVGPIGLLCIQRTLARGRRIGFVSGLGAATADAAYGALGIFGISALTATFVALRLPLALLGALFLAWMGMQILRSPAPSQAAQAGDIREGGAAFKAYASVLLLTLTNPMTILSFSAIFATLSAGAATTTSPLWMVLGVFLGSAIWWLGLSLVVAALRHRIKARSMVRINQIAGLVLLGFAVSQLASLWINR
ncbi:LysE family translocator [Variovorax sp. HJSM1_2]|uniref:LysE family translocator n=1 Tax=Variovorax sp. HJSM1_2 TaxID=3366263 RepID=UPI003BC2F33D